MTLSEISSLPAETDNLTIYKLFSDTVTEKDIERGTNRNLFASAQLIEWAIRKKKFTVYYEYFNPLPEKENWAEKERFIKTKEVIVVFNIACVPRFGFLGEDDGEDCIVFPEAKGMFCAHI